MVRPAQTAEFELDATNNRETEHRERILSAARSVFLEGPADQRTMDAVAQAAGMSKKTIYREFKSQLELLTALMEQTITDLPRPPAPTRASDLEQELTDVIVQLLSHLASAQSFNLMRMLMHEARRYPQLVRRSEKLSYPLRIVADWLDHDIVRARYEVGDAMESAGMLMGMLSHDSATRLLNECSEPISQEDLARRAERAVRIFMRGVELR